MVQAQPIERNAVSTTVASDAGTVSPARPRGRYVGLAALGLVLAAAAPLIFLIAGFVSGLDMSEDLVFFGLLTVVPLIAAALVWRFGAWARIVAIVVSLLVAFMAFWFVFGLAYPASFVDFVPAVLLPLGVLLALVGSVAAMVANRRGPAAPAAGERRVAMAALGIVALAVVVSAALNLTSTQRVDAAAAEGAAESTMRDFAFSEGSYRVTAGQPTTFLVRNTDPVVHTFTIAELGVDQTVLPGSEALVEVTADAGTYTLYCKPHSNPDNPDPAQGDMAASLVAE
jgi:plastocyanin